MIPRLLVVAVTTLLLCSNVNDVEGWSPAVQQKRTLASVKNGQSCEWKDFSGYHPLRIRGGAGTERSIFGYPSISSEKHVMSAAATSLLAGSVAGAVGVGVAFPLDTLKTKAQVMGQGAEDSVKFTMSQVIRNVYAEEGIGGFFGGVRGMMAGQALIKSVAFSVNAVALSVIQQQMPDLLPVAQLLMASCFSGFVTSFLVTPIERVKVMMQASGTGLYANEWECLQAILRTEGFKGLMGRGLGPTLAREVPSYGIYFFIYGFLMQTPAAAWLGKLAPLIFGALSGMASWLPVYPVDVVKTVVQNTEGEDISAIQVTKDLYANGGIGAFFDGLTPKMLRAAVNHAVTFYIYDMILTAVTGGVSS